MINKIKMLFIAFGVVAMIGCSFINSDNNSKPIDEDPFIRGKITDIKEGKVSNSILIEEDPEISDPLQPGGTKIWLALVDDTKIFVRNSDGLLKESNADVFKINKEIEGWVIGAIADSYPLQGAAKQIVVIQE